MPDEYTLILTCADRLGIVHAVSGFLARRGANIVDSQQFGDRYTGRFFMRVQFEAAPAERRVDALRVAFAPIAAEFAMEWGLHDIRVPGRILILVSKFGHCLNDLLYRQQVGSLPAEVCGVVSNHRDFESLAGSYGIPFHHVPVTAETKRQAEARLLGLVDEHEVDLVVLARYMQVLSDDLCEKLAGRVINIHHSFLPSFKGARPYHQAHERGVKLIGATAHYATGALDEGPIIEQEVCRVDHAAGPEQLTALGRDLESVALARAVRWHLEHRVVLNGQRTVVFR